MIKSKLIYLLSTTGIILIIIISLFIWKYLFLFFWDFGFKFVNVRVCNNTDTYIDGISIHEWFYNYDYIDPKKCSDYAKGSVFVLSNTSVYVHKENDKYLYLSWYGKIEWPDISDVTFHWKYTIDINSLENNEINYTITSDIRY
jgi:hypothetical protein